MTTTALFIELLIAGLQSAIWIGLIVLSVFGTDWINLERLKGFETILAVILLPIVYPLGVLIDYLADRVFTRWQKPLRHLYLKDKTQSALKLLTQTKDPFLTNYLDYIRRRIRLSRSAAINFALITVVSVIFTVVRCRSRVGFPFWKAVLFEVALGALLTGVAVLAWHKITCSFFKWVARGFNPDRVITDEGIIEEILTEQSVS